MQNMVLYFSQNAAMRDGVTSLCTEEYDTDTTSPKAHFFGSLKNTQIQIQKNRIVPAVAPKNH